ncbi:MAG TPA: hypothetical protein PLX41_11655 [Bacteroidales bacterium]|nr:hypothetical protein [Bacteroidales bacterium]
MYPSFPDFSKGKGHIESMDVHVSPGSLCLSQLKNRLGAEALKNIAREEQFKKISGQ